jgi:hypothetical protein
MSGGRFQYLSAQLEYVAQEIAEIIANNDTQSAGADYDLVGRGYSPEVLSELQNGVEALRRAAVYERRIDWLLSGDDGSENFLVRLKQELSNLSEKPLC